MHRLHIPCTWLSLRSCISSGGGSLRVDAGSAYPCPLLPPPVCQLMNPEGRGVCSLYCCKLLETELLITTDLLQAELSSPSRLPSQTISALGWEFSFRFISFPYLRTAMGPGTQAKTSKFITVLTTASCMLSEFCSPPSTPSSAKTCGAARSSDCRGRYLHMKNGSFGRCS